MNKIVGAAFVALILSVTLLLLMGVAVIGLEFWREVFG